MFPKKMYKINSILFNVIFNYETQHKFKKSFHYNSFAQRKYQ